MYLKLLGIASIPGIASIIVYLIQKKGWFSKLSYITKQLIIGLLFGFIACLGTAYGVDVGGALANTRDAAIVTSGLLFGGPSGIIAGLIGGVYRWYAVYWGAGEFTRLACSIACVLSGIYAAFARKYMFENKIPGWIMGFFVGSVMEVIHLMLLFFTNLDDMDKTLEVLNALTIPMIICNALGVAFSIFVITLLSGSEIFYNRKKYKARISQTIQGWLLFTVLLALIFSSVFTFYQQSGIASLDARTIMEDTLSDVTQEIKDASDDNLLRITAQIENELSKNDVITDSMLSDYCRIYNVNEINIVNKSGIITQSTNPSYINFDMNSGEQSHEFMCLISEKRSYVQEYMPVSYDSDILMKYAGVRRSKGGFVQVGYTTDGFYDDLKSRISLAAVNRHIESTGYVLILDKNNRFVSYSSNSDIPFLSDEAGNTVFGRIIANIPEKTIVTGNVLNRDVYCMYTKAEGYTIVAVYPINEAFFTRDVALYANTFIMIILFAILFALIYILIRIVVVNNIHKINQSLAEITGGNLDTIVNVRNNEEFSLLSNDINSTVDTLKRYIEEAASRIDAELQYAKDIQSSALPNVSPDFVNKSNFELHACMFTAKEVGGDFYDFYYVDDTHLAITIADVSGKGIPAALFMMTSKTMLKNMIESGMSIDVAMTSANEKLCEGNDADMFVTTWAAVIDLETGHIIFGNAGHNPPVIKKKDGSFEYLKCRAGLVLAGMDGFKYRSQEFDMEPGDVLYLYTDGVTEATNSNSELYGEDRLLTSLSANYNSNTSMEELCSSIKSDVDLFVGDAPQFDDITMLAFKYTK